MLSPLSDLVPFCTEQRSTCPRSPAGRPPSRCKSHIQRDRPWRLFPGLFFTITSLDHTHQRDFEPTGPRERCALCKRMSVAGGASAYTDGDGRPLCLFVQLLYLLATCLPSLGLSSHVHRSVQFNSGKRCREE